MFTIPIFGGIPVKESVVVTWIIMAVIVGLCIIFVRSLSVENPGKVQLLLESAIGKGVDFFEDVMGKENRKYIPYLITVLIYIGIANIIGLFGFKSPTKDLNVTAALAIMSMCLIEFSGIRKNGFKHWAAHFAKPVPFVAPIMVLEIVIRPLSLCMRLFGNVLGAFVIMELLKAVAPVLIPIPFSFYFDIFDGFLQAYVFVFLKSIRKKEIKIMLVAIGAAVAVLTGLGAGLGISLATGKAVDAIARQPEAESKISKNLILGCALAEATAIYGFIIGLLIILMLK